ncbi:MAG: hypothetical protein QXP81_02120 [Nitrososphaerota archaeon]|nr:hypothetical protein [Candidatus Calditenuis fumarioli]
MMELTGEEIVRRIVSDKAALRELAYHLVSDPDLRLAVINAVLAEVATRHDLREVRQELGRLRDEIDRLRGEMDRLGDGMNRFRDDMDGKLDELRREMRSLIRWTITTVLVVWGSTVLPVMLRLAGVI